MKILHTADWHLGKRLEKFSRLDEQRLVLNEIAEIAEAEDVDAVLIAGDLFDNFNPSSEAVELLYKTLKSLSNNGKRAVIAIAGNHDSPDRIEAPDPLARECGIIFAGYPDSVVTACELESGLCVLKSEAGFLELKLPRFEYPLRLILTPYANEFRLKTFLGLENSEDELRDVLANKWKALADAHCDDKGVNLLVAHLFVMKRGEEPPEEPEDEKPILHVGGAQAIYSENIPKQIQYVALGHLHRFRVVDQQPCPIVYSSSPLCYSFGEAGQEKHVAIITAKPGEKVSFTKASLKEGKPLWRKKFYDVDEALLWLANNQNALVELTLVSENYLNADDRKRLNQAHDGIVTIIPEVKSQDMLHQSKQTIDLNQDINELFQHFFQHKYGQLPNTELIDLFKEIRAEHTEE